MAERPLYTLYKNLKAQNYDVPNDYNKFESALTRDGKSGADNRHAIYENLKAQNFDVPDTYERFYTALFEPRSKTSSRAKGGSVPMSAADRARFSAGAAAISASANQIANNAGRYNRLKQRKQKQQKDFGRVNLGTHLTPFGGDANNVVKDEFAYNPETGKAGAYVTSDNENAYTQSDAEQKQAILDKYGEEWNKAVDMGMVPSELDKADPGLSDTDVSMRQMERRQEWLDENQNRRSKELNESMHLQDSPFVASGGAVAPSSFNAAIGNEANRLSDAEYGAYNTAKAYNQMLRTTLLQELKEQKQRNEDAGWWKDKWNDVSNYFGAMFDTMLDPKLYSQGVMDAAIASNLLQVKKGMEDGTIKKGSNAGEAAQVMLSAIQQQQGEAAKQQQYGTKAYQYGDMSGRSLKFLVDFALSGWRNVMTTGFTKAGEKVGEKMALGALGKWFTKNTGRVLGDMAGSAALAATNQLGSTYNNVIERYVGMNNENGGVTQDKNGDLSFNKGVSLGKAIKDGFGSATIENFSEMFGEYLPGASKILSKLGLSKVSSFFEKIGNNAYYKWLSNATNKSGIQGVMSEIAEEEFGTALHAAWGDGDGSWSDFNVFTNPDAREKQIDTCLGMFYSVGFMQSPRTSVGAINAVKYFHIKLQVTKADKFGQMMFNDKWDDIKSKIDVTTNADLTKTVLDATRSDSMTAKQKGAVINYAMFLSKLRGFNQASDAKTKDKVEEGETVPTLSNYLDDAYTEGHNADDADKHDIQIQHEDQAKTLAAALNISEQQLSGMSDEELESLTGQDDKLDQAIYDYQLSTARYQGVVDDAQDKVDLAAHQAEQRVNMYTDQSRGSVRNATIKASGGAEDYGVYIISGNIATHDDGSIDVSNSDDMILYFDPTTNSVEHADALMFAELGEELPADAVKAQAVVDAKENAIKEVAGIIDGTVEVGSQFSVTDADGTEHTYEVLADNGDGTAMITIDGNVPTELVKGENVQIPYSFADLQQMKDLEDQKRLEAAKAEREQMEKERAGQQNQETEESQPSFDFNQILNDNGNVVLVDVLGKDGNTKYPGSKLFLIRDAGAKAKVVEMKSDGTLVPHAVNKEDVATISTMTLDEYKQAMPSSSMIEDNSGENRGEIEEEAPTIDGETAGSAEETAAPESTEATATEQTPTITLEDGTVVPMLEDGNPDFSKLSAAQTAELYDTQFDEDADGIVSGYVSDAKKALDKSNNMTVKGKTFVEQKAAKAAKEKAIADAQAAYDSAIAIRDAYNERQLAKEENTPEGRKSLIEKARRKFTRLKNSEEWSERTGDLWNETVGKLLHRLYDATGIDVFNDTPNTVYEYVAANVGPYSLNYEGNDNSKGVQQETGLSRSDFAKLGWLAAEGKGMTIDAKVHRLWENRPSNLESADTQEIRNALISLITSGQTAFQARDYILNQRIELAESALEEQLRQEEDAAEAQKAKEEEEKKKAEEEKTNENRNAPELSHEQQKAKEEGEKLGFPAVDKEGEPINQNVIELANWAKEQGLEIDPTSKLNSYADLYVMCKGGFGVSMLVPDVGEDINQVFYFPDNVQGEQLAKLQEEFNVGRDLKHSADMNSELTEGAMFYDGDTAREFKEFVDKKVEMQNKVFGEQRPEEDLPFSAKDNGQQQTTSEREADVERNKVDDMKVVDNIVGQKTRKAFERLAKMMGAEIQWQYSDKLGNGWIQETTDTDGNVHRTIFITLDSSITEGAQFIFGHEMTHQIKSLNHAAYNELTQLVLDTYGSDTFDKAVDETTKRYSDAGFSGRDRDYYAEEVVADAVGEMIRDLNLAHTLAMKMSHPLLAAIHEILQKIKLAFYGTEYSDVTKNIIRSIEQAYVKTAKGEVENSETGENVSFSLRQKPEPKKKGIGYKVFVLKEGKLYPPMVANPDGAATPVGVWLDADAAPIAGESKTGRPQVKQGGKGTQGGSGKLAYRPGWHLGVVPYAIQFNRKDAEGNKTLFPKNFVFAEVEYAADVDYQEEARQEGINPSGKYQHSLAGLKHLPTDGYYMYRTNPNPETDPWVITGAMKVNRILTRTEQAELVKNAGREPQQIQEGDIVTDDVVNSINQEIADAPKFSLKVYHGSGADFTEFDFDHMGEGAGSQAFGWGGYVTSSKKIGKSYATLMDNDPSKAYYRIQRSNGTRFAKKYPTIESFLHGDKQIAKNDKFTEQEKIDYYNEMKKLAEPYHNLYEVDIPEDNGGNYLDWDAPITDELIDKVAKALTSLRSYDIKDLKKDRTFDNFYKTISMRSVKDDATFNDDKAASKLLSSLGYTGIKYKAGRNFGGAEEGDTNYVIFKPEDMQITEHTKFSLRLKSAIDETETNPSDAQKESGNYKKGHIKFGGYDYTIENPKGSTRSGKDANGKEWKVTMHDTYGYIRGKYGKDGDHLDMFINDKADLDNWNGDVFVVDQVNPDGSFDEHKVMYGYDSMSDAEKAYLANYSEGWQGLGNITGASKAEFDKWLGTSNRKLKPFADYAKVKFSQAQSVAEPRQSLDDIKPVSVGAFGNIYNQFRGKAKAAIEFLKKLGSGEATAALHHHTIGDISLVWGDKKTGLDKILRKHPEVVDNLQSIIDSMEVVKESDNRIKLESPTHFAVVSKEYKGEPREQWLLTAYEKRESLENDKSMDTATSSLGGDTALSQSKGSGAKIDNSSETSKENGEKFSLKDEEYLKAVEDGDMEKAQKMVNEAAEKAGYTSGSDYQGTSAFNGSAPWGNGYFLTKEERKEAWDNGEFEGESTLGDYINDGIDGGNLEQLTNSASYRAADNMRKKAILNVRNAIRDKAKTIKMYRSVPSSVKEGSFRNGDWITPSKDYAKDNAKIHGWGNDYNIIEQKVPVDDVWFDGNDIAEWGYGIEKDYINDTDFAYKNVKNNRKLLDVVTYNDNGEVIPLSQRFDPSKSDTRFSLRYDQFEHDLNQWKKDNNLPKDAKRPTIPQRNVGESAVDFLKRVDEYRKQMALWKTAPTYEQHLLSDDTALGEFNRELQRGSVLKRIAFQDSMLAIRKAQEAIMKEVGVDRLNMAEDAYTAENRSHGKGKNEFEEYNNEFLQPLRKAYHQMKKVLGDSYDNVRIYMMAKHGLERDAQMAFKKSLEADYEDVAQRSAAYRAYKGDIDRIVNDTDLELGRVDFTTWRQRDNALRTKYSPSYMNFRYDKMGIAFDYSGLSALFDGSDFEEAAHKLVRDIESKHIVETKELWDATNAATKKILRDGYKAGMMSEDTYQYVRDMYSHYIPLRGWDGTTADQVWDYVGGGNGAFNQTLKKAHGRTSIADDPIAYIENMAESGILLNNKNWVKQHLMLLAQNHPTSLLTLSKAWYVKSVDDNGNEEWIPATPQITSQMNSNQVKAAIDAFEQKMEQMEQTGDATQKRDGLNIAYPQTHSEEREHEVRVMKDGEEYVIYVNGDPQLAQAMNNTRAHRVREIQSGKLDRAAAWLGRKMAAAYTSLSPLFIPSNYFRDLTMTLASTAIREDGRYNYLLRKNLATSWNLGFMLKDYQNGKLREKVSNGNATPKEQMFYDFMMNGGETGFVSSLDVEDLKKKFKNDLKDLDRWKANPVKVGHTIMDVIEFLNRMIEDSNRFAIYMTSIQYGRSIDEAVNDAKDVTLNFNRKGTGEYGWQMIRNLYLFINPAVQSLQTLGALAKHHPFKFTAVTASWLASGVLVPIVNAALMQIAAAFGGGDGDDKKWYKDISKKYWQFTKWDRRNNLIMWFPFTHEFIKIPLAQEFRAFYGVGDMIASKMMGGELAEESWSQYAEDLLGQVVDMLPLDPTGYDGNIAVSLMPNAVRPVFELAFNVDFTGKPLFKETEYNKYDPNFTKAYVGTPDWLVRASRMMNSIGNDYPDVQQNKWDALGNPRFSINNPAVVDHVLSSYLGGAYTMGSQVLGVLTKSLNDPKEIKVADIPLFSKFVSNPDDRPVSKKQGDEFWDKKEYYDRASNTISKLKKQAKIDGDYSLLERFYGSEEYKTYKLYEKDVKDYKETRKKERAEESGDEYKPHQINAEDIYNNHTTSMDEFEDMKLKQLFEKLNSFKNRYDAIVDNAPNESDGYYNTNKAAIDAIDEISLDKQEISELKKGFLDDGKDAYNAEDMKQIRELRKKVLAVLEKANKVVVANQKAKKK